MLTAGLVGLGVALVLVAFLSVTQGSRAIGLAEVLQALAGLGGGTINDTVTVELRVPRTLLGILAGAALGVAGAILQGVTRNPLADAGIMGINSGAAAFVVFAITVLGVRGIGVYVWFAFAGAIVALVGVYVVASLGREGATPVKLALAGAAVTAGLASVTTGIVLTNVDTLNELRFWQVGSLAGRYAPDPGRRGAVPGRRAGRLARLRPGPQRAGPRRGHRPWAGPAGRRSPGPRRSAWSPSWPARPPPPADRSSSSDWSCRTSPGSSAVPTTGGSSRTRCCWRRCCCCSPTSSAGCWALPGELQVGVVLAVLGAPMFVAIVRYARLSEI